ncbi:uncharacterized protein LOC129000229 [Macrosteles quadrilineatus]|uniref:uncharacterized protein LOC129000229 n=1 Tax=Macrosteles quadrilineatus TaxID=74068 RepID=UPI0023E0CC0A|nr:uncharacterized protein LOC129000229 [Macrosteles quadrilineatus]
MSIPSGRSLAGRPDTKRRQDDSCQTVQFRTERVWGGHDSGQTVQFRSQGSAFSPGRNVYVTSAWWPSQWQYIYRPRRPLLCLTTAMVSSVVVLVLAVCSSVIAYDFQDSNFNEILADQLEDLDLAFSFRQRRGISSESSANPSDKLFKCKHHYGKSCCGTGKWMKHFAPGIEDSVREAYGECYKDFQQRLNASEANAEVSFFSCESANQMKMKVICTAECIAKKADLINEDGVVNTDKAISHMDKIEYEDWQKPIVVDAITKCAPLVKTEKVSTPHTGDISCSLAMISFQHCVFVESEKNCPENQKKTDEKCKRHFEKYESMKPNDIGKI